MQAVSSTFGSNQFKKRRGSRLFAPERLLKRDEYAYFLFQIALVWHQARGDLRLQNTVGSGPTQTHKSSHEAKYKYLYKVVILMCPKPPWHRFPSLAHFHSVI